MASNSPDQVHLARPTTIVVATPEMPMANPAKAGAFAMADHKRQREDGGGPPLLRVMCWALRWDRQQKRR